MSTSACRPWPRWLLVAVLGLAVVAMHHLPQVSVHGCPPANTVNPTPVSPHAGGPVMSPAGGQDSPDMAAMEHLCLAVVDAAHLHPAPQPALVNNSASALAVPVLATWVSKRGARAPPPSLSVRLAQLGVWRR